MLACVSPSDTNLAETVSTLTYAAKANQIRNLVPWMEAQSSKPQIVFLVGLEGGTLGTSKMMLGEL